MTIGRRFGPRILAVASAAALLVLPTVRRAEAAVPQCFGAPATIVVTTPGGVTNGTTGADVIVGTTGDDEINGRGGDDIICGGRGADFLIGGLGGDQISGGVGDDFVVGDNASPGPARGEGDDELHGDGGEDFLIGDSYSDAAASGGGADVMYGGAGPDHIYGDSFGSSANGGGDDYLDGGDGDDSIRGDSKAYAGDATGAGNDVLLGRLGKDFMAGDSDAAGNAYGSGDDLLDLGPDGGAMALGDHNITEPDGGKALGAGNDSIIGGRAGDLLVGDSSVADASQTTAGDDDLSGRDGNDRFFGDNINYALTAAVGGAHGVDNCSGGPGTDSAVRCEWTTGVP
ncbi:MAG: hypothetical protein QOI61_1944 [Actinomycetota bacterium]